MGKYSKYQVELKGLKPGKHQLSYDLTDTFFALINDEESDVKRGSLKLTLDINKVAEVYELNFHIEGVVLIPCDRCLDDVEMMVDVNNKLFVKFGEKFSEESDEVVIVPEVEGNINIAWFVYEFIVLSLPIKRVHPYGMCNREVLAKLKKHKTYMKEDLDSDDLDDDDLDLDADSEEPTNDAPVDPRWNSLKDLNE